MNDFVEIQRLFSTILRRGWLFIMVTVLAAAAGYWVSQRQPKVYQATTSILVGESIKSAQLDRVDIQTSQALVQTYVDIARRQPVLKGVVNELKLPDTWQDLKKQVKVSQVPETQLIEIKVEAGSPKAAEAIADEIAHQLLLISPSTGAASQTTPIDEFNQQQAEALQQQILQGQERLKEINDQLSAPTSPDQADALQSEKTSLENMLVEWGRNYTEILPFAQKSTARDPNQLTVIETAHASAAPIRPNIQLNTLFSGLLGMVLAIGLIFLLDFLDDTFKTADDFSQGEDIKLLGSIGRIKGGKAAAQVVANLEPRSAVTESYRIIRSRIRFRPPEKAAKTFMITSPMQGEGKSITAANLAVVFAQANLKTILVDADLRHPTLHEMFELQNERGLGDLLEATEPGVYDTLQNTPVKNLRFLASGNGIVDPSERLGSERMAEIMSQLSKMADIVIFDSPPTLVFADGVELSRRVDGVIVVVRARKSRRDAVNQVIFDLRNAGAKVLGSVFNDAPRNQTFAAKGAYLQDRSQPGFSTSRANEVKGKEAVPASEPSVRAVKALEEQVEAIMNEQADLTSQEPKKLDPEEQAEASVQEPIEMETVQAKPALPEPVVEAGQEAAEAAVQEQTEAAQDQAEAILPESLTSAEEIKAMPEVLEQSKNGRKNHRRHH